MFIVKTSRLHDYNPGEMFHLDTFLCLRTQVEEEAVANSLKHDFLLIFIIF